jgi:glutamyl-Q tRNA(Asp) synthetase
VAANIYRGRFAPSPTGPLHAGSLVAALASWLDARAHQGSWLLRIEDVDTPRCVAGADRVILQQLAACGLVPDELPVYQRDRGALYQQALDSLVAQGMAYPCACTRQDIARALIAAGVSRQRHAQLFYPGTCRHGTSGRPARAWRFLTDISQQNSAAAQPIRAQQAIDLLAPKEAANDVVWSDRRLGQQTQDVSRYTGDFILKRADGLWAYQLAVVVDDAAQRITHVVRGEDLTDNTARQILLQRALGLPQPAYLHTPLVLAPDGEKLSKQNAARALDVTEPMRALQAAGHILGLHPEAGNVADWLASAVAEWRNSMAGQPP